MNVFGKNHLFARNPSLAALWLSQAMSQVGTRMYQMALGWWMVQSSSSSSGLMLALFFVISSLPALVLLKPIGQIIDRYSPLKVLRTSELSAGLVCLLFALIWHQGGEWLLLSLYVRGLFIATAQAFVDPASLKSVGIVAQGKDVESATALMTNTTTVASLVGAFLGALVIDKLGLEGVLWLNSLSYIVSYSILFVVRTQSTAGQGTRVNEVSGELNQVPGYSLIHRVLLIFGCVNFFATPTLLIIPLFVKNRLNGQALDLAIIEAALAVGMFMGALSSSRFRIQGTPFRFAGVCLVLFGACLALQALVQTVWIYAVVLFAAGAFMGIMNTKVISYFQVAVPEALQGRFFARLTAMTSAAFPLAFLVFGAATESMSLISLILLQAIFVCVIGAALYCIERKPAYGT
jgi:MFS family permease